MQMQDMDNAQELLNRLNQKNIRLSKSHWKIAECILTHCDKVAFMTAERLGEYVGVSESTVVRFALALGYSGYPELQKALQEMLRHRLTSSQRFEMTSDMDHSQVLNNVLKADMQNIRLTLEEIDLKAFELAIDSIICAHRIYVMGLRASAPIAEFFAHYLTFIFPNVCVATSGVNDLFEQLSRIEQGDLLIGISFPRYASRTIELMEYARKRGATVLAITDGPLSPLHATSDICLMAKCSMSSFIDSFTAPLSLINALLVALSQRRRTEVTEYLDQMEKLWKDHNIYMARTPGLNGEKHEYDS